jgi:hypothetical protein
LDFRLETFAPTVTVGVYFLCQGIALGATFLYGSFFEWALHRNVMHRKTWISYPFELHAMLHHKLFQHDETFHAQDDEMKKHVTFVPRDYILLLLVNAPVFLTVELIFQIPVTAGGLLACLIYLCAFDLLHWAFHVPNGRFFENWGWFRWIKQHHLLHHRYQNRNLNVVLPLADFVLRTRVSGFRKPEDALPLGRREKEAQPPCPTPESRRT